MMLNWEGPYVVKKTFSRGALILTEMGCRDLPNPMNSDLVKRKKKGEAKAKTCKGRLETKGVLS
ncbi:RNA-directed DNA polymerase (Reverse transcriptase), Ribonuclease H [Gossypium australe]|uniref:RNA-directed DNA polymerase (Reverse transcriptase), Ribonuclease H n=1 Tax=Gossypium australe TaxID=47621 RepID=A0A5B6UDG1_9ROSI|nr:RNA-directed DNA polymerase (Reverse transcriptase), Ribonuclease H [Gossypium australe]